MTNDLLPELPEPNIPLLRKAIEWATVEAEKPWDEREWYQGAWAAQRTCGTTYCIAGYVVMNAMPNAVATRDLEEDPEADLVLTIDDERAYWPDVAQELLGLTYEERLNLFAGVNDIDAVRRVAERIAYRAGEHL